MDENTKRFIFDRSHVFGLTSYHHSPIHLAAGLFLVFSYLTANIAFGADTNLGRN